MIVFFSKGSLKIKPSDSAAVSGIKIQFNEIIASKTAGIKGKNLIIFIN